MMLYMHFESMAGLGFLGALCPPFAAQGRSYKGPRFL